MLNPLARIIVDMRSAVLNGFIPNIKNITITTTICILSLVIGYFVFKKLSKKFAEEL